MKKKRSLKELLGLVLCGGAMGACDVVPGVSGGTMAFLLGIYEELIASIRTFGRKGFWLSLVTFRWRAVGAMVNWRFLVAVGLGIALAIVSLAKVIEYLLEHHPILVWSFFFGLVLASVFTVGRRIPRWTASLIIALLVGAAAAYLIVGMVPVQTPEEPWFLVLSGAIAICAMILPGISGSFLLVLLGKYEFVLSAVNNRDFVVIAYVGIGAVVGIIIFAQVLGWFFRRHHDLTVVVLMGLMLGSLRKVWPWKADVEWLVNDGGEKVVEVKANFLPPIMVDGAVNVDLLIALGLMLFGFLLVFLIDRIAHLSGQNS